ncbi:MAG: hypothetical protein B7Z37_07230 [Verrucomicrobia bacterium 12-59-8]|nr:MAG: hypothetical protein B7Z37_07230 [Verrucomicrobia bacterium 12-59-8]
MSYLHTPRISFSGSFLADPSTINNNDSNFDPTVKLSNEKADPKNPLSNTSVYWNPNGTHNWKLVDCQVLGASTENGTVEAPSADKLIGASVRGAGKYPAKLVDLDPDNMCVSQIWGLKVQIAIPNPEDPANPLASVTGDLPPTAFGDLWNRSYLGPGGSQIGMPSMCAVFQNVLTNVVWVNETLSPILTQLKALSPDCLSLRLIVDSYQSIATAENFTHGRLTGTLGPAFADEPPRSPPRRLPPVLFWDPPTLQAKDLKYISPGGIFSNYGPAGVLLDEKRGVLVLDLGNCVPTIQPQPKQQVPNAGWPVVDTTFNVLLGQPAAAASTAPAATPELQAAMAANQMGLKSGAGYLAAAAASPTLGSSPQPVAENLAAATTLGTVHFTADVFQKQGGILELPLSAALVQAAASQPLALQATSASSSVLPTPYIAVHEDSAGLYVDVYTPFYRLDPGDTTAVTLVARQFGRPWAGASLSLTRQPVAYAANGPNPTGDLPPVPTPIAHPPVQPYAWYNGDPPDALLMTAPGGTPVPGSDSLTVVTDANGLATLELHAGDPGRARYYAADNQNGPDGQVYFININPYWASTDPQIFNFSGAQLNVLVFSGYQAQSDPPSWDLDVGPIFSHYARMAPFMKGIIDLSDYTVVTDKIQGNGPHIQHLLNFPREDPHHMPITRDLSAAKLAVINDWFKAGTPKSPPTPAGPGTLA